MNCQDLREIPTLNDIPALVLLMEGGKQVWLKDQMFVQKGETHWTVTPPEGKQTQWVVGYTCEVDLGT